MKGLCERPCCRYAGFAFIWRPDTKSSRYLAAFAAGCAFLLAADVWALSITHVLDENFGSDPADGSVSITFDDGVGVDQVKITLDAGNLATDEVVAKWYFNYSADGGTPFDATGLIASSLSGTGNDATTLGDIGLFSSQSKVAGGYGTFNIVVDFKKGNPSFGGGETVMFILSGVTGLTADDFFFFSDPGPELRVYYSAAKIHRTNCVTAGCNDPGDGNGDDNDGSDWLGAVPEPGPLALFATSLIVAGGMMRRPRAR